MHIMFVCTGNICRSPMGELLLTRYLRGTSIRVSSAGTKGLTTHQIDPSARRIMDSIGIDSSGFRSRRLTRPMVQSADLILCFEQSQRKSIVTLVPTAVRYTFLLSDFANMCEYCAQRGLIGGTTIQERLQSVVAQSAMIRAMVPDSQDIEDPHNQEFEKFHDAANATNAAIRRILTSMRKHYQVQRGVERRQLLSVNRSHEVSYLQ
ncbi:arsenate reductase/protein-tyrosine-phosphatase family protein [Bifidobacterium subtile]|jgi:protein-tyrosine phosphatase|uniref:Putative low molecular weight protein-tyrosine-phosphatase n=1 Tax=Bifidobacterium subtile TaxID=77635 RepID=A0A087EC38_9BIFI|nr:protein-tyrosine-phosphatase [Bifidobacterium subtile]KFJ05339.1 putative low molecular weight protein-tyrosine-phosphatase [Bifidobacterium subtile]QOL36756.1 low molecular weight phosphatase family protein [Bifidobacterium subtile]